MTHRSADSDFEPTGAQPTCSRRRLLYYASLGSLAATTYGRVSALESKRPTSSKLIGFSKPFQSYSPTETAELVAEIGWDGIECPVRPKGQIEPERVEEDLPRLCDALRQVGCEVTLLSTGIKQLNPMAERVLRTASRLGIKYYRLGFWNYSQKLPIENQVAEIRAAMRDLAALNKELGLQGAHQNHSGADYFGAPIWDIYDTVKETAGNEFGICFDIGHATIEGGLSWPIQARLMRPMLTAVFVKDFTWKQTEKGWIVDWCPLGKGMVNREFFHMLKQTGFDGPICQHHEYELGSRASMVAAMKQDLQVLRSWL